MSKSLACYGGLASFFAVKSLTEICISQNYFYSIFQKIENPGMLHRSSKTSRYHKSKNLACYGGLASFFAVKSLTKACMSQNCFTSIKKIQK